MLRRPNRISACGRRFAARDALTPRPPFDEALGHNRRKLTKGQSAPDKSNGLLGEIAVDGLVFEFMGLAILALCLIVLAFPSQRRPSRHLGE